MSEGCHDGAPRGEAIAASTEALVALVGRPNSGKSALFNRLTGGDAHVGNFPGITVDLHEGDLEVPRVGAVTIVDVPGMYSLDVPLDPDTDEGIAQRFLADRAPALVAQVLDGTHLALGLLLTRELVRRPGRLALVVTQNDVVEREGRRIDREALERTLGVPVAVVSSREPSSRAAVLETFARALEADRRLGAEVKWEAHALAAEVVRDAEGASAAALARRTRTERVDAWLLHPILGPVAFLGAMTALFAAVFLVADPASTFFGAAIDAVGTLVGRVVPEGFLRSLVVDGVLGGAGTVLGFLPQIVVLAVAIELLEATGYLARGAFIVDRVLRSAGLGGRSFVPLLMGHACAVPAITATRIVRDPRERLATILVLPLMTCSARIPTYALLVAAFFRGRGPLFQGAVFVALYFAGVGSGIVAAGVLRRTLIRGRGLPMVLEMPAYRWPEPSRLARVAWQSARRFAYDVGRVIVLASVVLWTLLTVPSPFGGASPPAHDSPAATANTESPAASEAAARLEHSVAASVGRALEPLTRPLGFDWRINVGLIGSFGARELMVSTLGVIFGIEHADDDPAPLAGRLRAARNADGAPAYDLATGLALLAFFVLACQCTSTVAVVGRETKSLRWPAFTLAYTYALAWCAAFVAHVLASRIGLG